MRTRSHISRIFQDVGDTCMSPRIVRDPSPLSHLTISGSFCFCQQNEDLTNHSSAVYFFAGHKDGCGHLGYFYDFRDEEFARATLNPLPDEEFGEDRRVPAAHLVAIAKSQLASPGEHLDPQFPAKLCRHGTFQRLHEIRGCAVIVFDGFCTILDRDPRPLTQIFIMRGFIHVGKSTQPAHVIHRDPD